MKQAFVYSFFLARITTELLLREQERTGGIHFRSFYARRILRIWPLYYLGVALAVAWGLRYPKFQLSATQIAELVFLVGWMGKILAYNPFGVLWTISVEELFYASWPWLANKGSILGASLLIIPAALCVAAYQGTVIPGITGLFTSCTLQRELWSPFTSMGPIGNAHLAGVPYFSPFAWVIGCSCILR